MYVVRVSYIGSEITVICPVATENEAMDFAYNIAKKRFYYYDMPESFYEMMDNENYGFIEILCDNAELFLPTNMEVYL